MKVVVVAHGLSNGGAERVAALIANDYAKNENEVLFIAVYSDKKEYILDDRIKYIYINEQQSNRAIKLLMRSYKINEAIKEFKADVVVSFIINEMLLCNILKTAPIIYSLRNDPTHLLSSRLNKLICIFSYKRAKNIVFQTPGAREYFKESIQQKGVIIPNPLTENLPYWDADKSEKVIITACRLNKQKNLKMLIKAFSLFHENNKEYVLKIYGKGNELDNLKKYAKECGIESCTFFPGHSSNIHSIMARSAIFALTSDFEGLSNSMLEALAIGIPTVCTDCPPGGAALYIEDGINGMLVPVGDSYMLYEKFCLMGKDVRLCKEMSKKEIEIRHKLSKENVLQKWERIIQ